MGLNWNEMKSRALLFTKTWADACNENSQAKPFWIDFFEILGITDKRVGTFEQHVKKLGGQRGFMDLFWPGFGGEPLSDKIDAANQIKAGGSNSLAIAQLQADNSPLDIVNSVLAQANLTIQLKRDYFSAMAISDKSVCRPKWI